MTGSVQGNGNYAPASSPVTTNIVHTDLEGIFGGRSSIRSGSIDMPIYSAWPVAGPGSCPVVLVLSEAFGLHEHIEDICRRFAKQGFAAVAPELMIRQGDPRSFDDVGALVRDLLVKIPDEQVMGDLDACVQWATEIGADTSRLSATGFCWGGRWTWLYAAHQRLASAVAWYGILDGSSSGLFPEDPARFPAHPIDLKDRLRTPVLGLYGAEDEAIPLSTVERMAAQLGSGTEAARASRIHVYPGAGHAFFADYRASYDAPAAMDGWSRCLAWIEAGMRPADADE